MCDMILCVYYKKNIHHLVDYLMILHLAKRYNIYNSTSYNILYIQLEVLYA